MKAKNLYKNTKEAEVDMTPMLDIVFILLIFFIVTTSFVKEEGILVNRPTANTLSENKSPVLMVNISESGLITLNGKQVDIERLPARIAHFLAKNETLSAVVTPNENTLHNVVVNVLDQIKVFPELTISIGTR